MYTELHSRTGLAECIHALQHVGVSDRAKVVKTWLHGRVTTYRIKQGFLHNCLLGCAGEADSLSHYLQCPRIFAAICFVFPEANADPLVRCGLRSPTKRNLQMCACVFSAYHALKNRVRSEFDTCLPDDLDFYPYWRLFAQSLAAEAVERRLTSSLFSSASFASFLNDSST